MMSGESMAPDLVERVRGILDAASREDWDAILAHYASDAVWDTEGMGTFKGPAAIRGFWKDWWGSYEHLQIDVLEIRDLGNGVVLAAFHFEGPPKGTTAKAETHIVLVYEWVDGTVVRVTTYFDLDTGEAAAERLAEQRGEAMSENLDLVRSIYAAWERGDFGSAEWAHPDVELVIDDGPDRGTVKGVGAMVQAWRDFLSAWEDYRVEAEEYRELDGNRVLVLMRHGGRGGTSGLEVGQLKTAGANLFDVRDGRVARLTLYWQRGPAFADLGHDE